MPILSRKQRAVMYSVIAVLVLIFGIIFPVYHLYDPLFKENPEITVRGGYYNVTYSGDFKNITDTSNAFLFSTNASVATAIETGHPNSTLDVQLTKGVIFYLGAPSDVVTIMYNLSVRGHFAGNLHPESLTISFGAIGPNQSSVILETWAPPYSSWIPTAQNLSPDTLGNLILVGAGNVSVTTGLLNQSNNVPFYNFHVSVQMWLTVKWYTGSSHLFDLSAQVNGLSKPVNSTLSMKIVETG